MIYTALFSVLFSVLLLGGIVGFVIFTIKHHNAEDTIYSIKDKMDNTGESYYHDQAELEMLKQKANRYEGQLTEAKLSSKRSSMVRIIFLILAIISLGLLICIPGSFHTVEAGEIAVVRNLGKIEGTRSAGTYFDFYMTKKYDLYDLKVQNVDIETATYSKDAQTMDIQMTIQYQVDPTKVSEIAQNYGTLDVLENRIVSVSVEAMKSTLSQSESMQIIQNRAEASLDVTTAVKNKISSEYYVSVTTVVLTDISFTDAYERAVENQMIAEREKEAAIIKAEQELEVARKAAEAAIAKANGDAAAQKALAGAEAYATVVKIAKLAESLGEDVTEVTESQQTDDGETEEVVVGYTITWTDDKTKQIVLDYLQYLEYLSKWNGELPDVVAGDNSLQLLIPTNNDNSVTP